MKTAFDEYQEKKLSRIIEQLQQYKQDCVEGVKVPEELVDYVIKVLHKIDLIPDIAEPIIVLFSSVMVELTYKLGCSYKLMVRIGTDFYFDVYAISKTSVGWMDYRPPYAGEIVPWINKLTKELK